MIHLIDAGGGVTKRESHLTNQCNIDMIMCRMEENGTMFKQEEEMVSFHKQVMSISLHHIYQYLKQFKHLLRKD